MKKQDKLDMWAECGDDFYYGREGEKVDYEIAFDFYQKAAKKKHPYSLYRMGCCYELGKGVKKDAALALTCYERAAALGSPQAQKRLDGSQPPDVTAESRQDSNAGVISLSAAMDLYDKLNFEQAFDAFLDLAEADNKEAQYVLGVMLANGEGVKPDLKTAAKWYERAAVSGHASAAYNLAILNYNGDGIKKDLTNALRWYEEAAKLGDITAWHDAAIMYYNGIGTAKDYGRALELFQLSAKEGDADAQYSLGIMHARGEGVAPNLPEAIRWLTKAAQQGLCAAQVALAEYVYMEEESVTGKRRAAYWFGKAAAQGHQDAAEKADGIDLPELPDYSSYSYDALKEALDQGKTKAKYCDPHVLLIVSLLMIKAARGKAALLDAAVVRAYLYDLLPGLQELRELVEAVFDTGAVEVLQTNPEKAVLLLTREEVGWFEAKSIVDCFVEAFKTPVSTRHNEVVCVNKTNTTGQGDDEVMNYDDMELEKLQQLADQGDVEAMYTLGTQYMAGEDEALDEEDAEVMARKFLQQAADAGHEGAAALLESLPYFTNDNDDEENSEDDSEDTAAPAWTPNFLAGDTGEIPVISEEDLRRYSGSEEQPSSVAHPVEHEPEKSDEEKGEDACRLALCYYKGANGYERNIEEAVKWLEVAAGYDYWPAYCVHANMLLHRDIVTGDDDEDEMAAEELEKAAKAGCAPAMSMLGALYWDGRGVTKDLNKAIYWYEQGLAGGDENCAPSLKKLREEQKLLEPDVSKASAKDLLKSGLYYHEAGDEKKALDYFELSAMRGNTDAMILAGLGYSEKCTPWDDLIAYYWMNEAVWEGGDENAMGWVTRKQYEQAQKGKSLDGLKLNKKHLTELIREARDSFDNVRFDYWRKIRHKEFGE